MLLLLLFIAKAQKRRADHRQAKTNQRRRKAQDAHLFCQNLRFFFAEPTAAVFGRPCRCGPTLRAHALQPNALVGMLGNPLLASPDTLDVCRSPVAQSLGAVFFEPRTSFLAKYFEVRHVDMPPTISFERRV